MLQGHRGHRRLRARMPDDPDRRRAAPAARHPRDRPARGANEDSGSSSAPTACGSPRTWRAAWREAGARGLSLSLDALDPDRHDHFRKVRAPGTTPSRERRSSTAGSRSSCRRPPARTIAGELEAIADFAHDRLAAKVWNLYFLVPTGRGQFVSDITPAAVRRGAGSLYRIQRNTWPHAGEREVRSALHQDRPRELGQGAGDDAAATPAQFGLSPIRTYSGGAGGCPAGTHYMGIRPNGDVTPCPYLPVFAGNLRSAALSDLWTSSPLFTGIRQRASLGGRCGECEMNAPLRRLPRARLRHDRRI